MSMKMDRIRELWHVIWRNSSNGEYTSATCERGCGNGARGGGLCALCARAELVEYVGNEMADEYYNLVTRVRALEGEMEAKATR